MTDFDGLDITYKWSARRRSIGLTITAEGRLVVAAPRGTSAAAISRALAAHRAWIERKTAERRQAWDKLAGNQVFFQGRPFRLKIEPGTETTLELRASELRLRLAGGNSDPWPALLAWYRREAESAIGARVKFFAARMGLRFSQIELCDWKRRWGECHPHNGLLRFNWRLIMLPPEILDYVVVHELAHLQVPGHPSRFWRRVEKVLPDWAGRRQWLNRDGTPFLLWRLGMK